MKQHWKMQRWITSVVSGLALAAATGTVMAQGTSPTNTFDIESSTASFVNWWGLAPTMTWDGTLDAANDPSSGSVRYEEAFVGAEGEQFMTFFTIANRWGWDGGTVIDASTYTNLSFDIRVDPSSGQRKANNDYGWLEVGYTTDGWGNTKVGEGGIPLSAKGAWVHVSYPMNPTMANIDKVNGFFIKMWSNGAHTNTLIFNVDNYMITKPTVPVVIPPPTMGIAKAPPTGVMVIMDDNSSQWQRNALVTPADGGPYLWTSQGSYPVSYSYTVSDFPEIKPHAGFEAHMYLVNGDTGGGNNVTSGSPDWGVPDIFIFRVENRVNTVYTTNETTITTNYTYNAWAQIQWKTNHPNANATNVPVAVPAPSALGTWTVTFTSATEGYLTGPGVTATNFALPADVVANNFSPTASYLQFGMFKNQDPNDGRNNGAYGMFNKVKFTGAAAPFEDDFSGPTLTNKYAWRKTSNSAVQFVPPGTAWTVGWTLPATSFSAEVSPSVTGPWDTAKFSTLFQSGSKMVGWVSQSDLPAGNAALFRLVKRPFVKLQVLMPGETAAPGTATGKTGTPTPQVIGNPFSIIVNAVDEKWNIVRSTDTIHLTSDDTGAVLPATDPVLAGGTVTINDLFFGQTGSWKITAEDVTDPTKTAGVGSATTVTQ